MPGKPIVLEGLPKQGPVRWGFREVKMVRPSCDECAPNTAKAKRHWWKECTHDPYVGSRTFTTVTNTYGDDEDGGRVITGKAEKTVERPWPNLVQVSASLMQNWGRSVEKMRSEKGFILPEELDSPAFPNGIARFCEFRECFSQEGLKKYGETYLCREEEALRIYESERGLTVEIQHGEKRNEQIADRLAKVRALTA